MYSIALIGCGEVAEHGHLPAILEDKRFQLKATCDLDRERAELLASSVGGARPYTDWRKLLSQEDKLDAAVLALPPEVSPDVAIGALRRGLAVLDEKPLATTLADGRRLQRTVEESGNVYQVGFVLRYGDWVEMIRNHVSQLGTPLQISVAVYDERHDPSDPEHLARISSFLSSSSAMTHEGSHVIDFVSRWVDARWISASAVAKQSSPLFGGPNLWDSRIDLGDRTTLHVKIGWLKPELLPSTVTIVGTEGRLDFNCTTGRGLLERNSEEILLESTPMEPQWRRQYATFFEAIERGRATLATVEDGLHALETTIACELSARSGVAVTAKELGCVDASPVLPSNGTTDGPVKHPLGSR